MAEYASGTTTTLGAGMPVTNLIPTIAPYSGWSGGTVLTGQQFLDEIAPGDPKPCLPKNFALTDEVLKITVSDTTATLFQSPQFAGEDLSTLPNFFVRFYVPRGGEDAMDTDAMRMIVQSDNGAAEIRNSTFWTIANGQNNDAHIGHNQFLFSFDDVSDGFSYSKVSQAGTFDSSNVTRLQFRVHGTASASTTPVVIYLLDWGWVTPQSPMVACAFDDGSPQQFDYANPAETGTNNILYKNGRHLPASLTTYPEFDPAGTTHMTPTEAQLWVGASGREWVYHGQHTGSGGTAGWQGLTRAQVLEELEEHWSLATIGATALGLTIQDVGSYAQGAHGKTTDGHYIEDVVNDYSANGGIRYMRGAGGALWWHPELGIECMPYHGQNFTCGQGSLLTDLTDITEINNKAKAMGVSYSYNYHSINQADTGTGQEVNLTDAHAIQQYLADQEDSNLITLGNYTDLANAASLEAKNMAKPVNATPTLDSTWAAANGPVLFCDPLQNDASTDISGNSVVTTLGTDWVWGDASGANGRGPRLSTAAGGINSRYRAAIGALPDVGTIAIVKVQEAAPASNFAREVSTVSVAPGSMIFRRNNAGSGYAASKAAAVTDTFTPAADPFAAAASVITTEVIAFTATSINVYTNGVLGISDNAMTGVSANGTDLNFFSGDSDTVVNEGARVLTVIVSSAAWDATQASSFHADPFAYLATASGTTGSGARRRMKNRRRRARMGA